MESGYHRKSTWQEPRADANVTTVSFLPGTSAMRRTQDLQWETVARGLSGSSSIIDSAWPSAQGFGAWTSG